MRRLVRRTKSYLQTLNKKTKRTKGKLSHIVFTSLPSISTDLQVFIQFLNVTVKNELS